MIADLHILFCCSPNIKEQVNFLNSYFCELHNKPGRLYLLSILEICRTGVCMWWSSWIQLVMVNITQDAARKLFDWGDTCKWVYSRALSWDLMSACSGEEGGIWERKVGCMEQCKGLWWCCNWSSNSSIWWPAKRRCDGKTLVWNYFWQISAFTVHLQNNGKNLLENSLLL